MRRRLSKEPQWQVPSKSDDAKQRWETYQYELACAELCGKGHYSMRNIVTIVEEDEYLDWMDKQEGGKLVEVVDSVTMDVSYSIEKGSVKSKYFSYFKTSDEFNPLTDKVSNFEKVVENKLIVSKYYNDIKEMRFAAEIDSEAFNMYESALNEMAPLLKAARLYQTSQVAASKKNAAKAKELYLSLTQKTEPVEEIIVPENTVTS